MNPPAQTILPRWRGFNLLDLFTVHSKGEFTENDFQWISDWGFNFVRIPASYTFWIKNNDPMQIDEKKFTKIDRLMQLGEKYDIHICMNFHRAPGYSVNPERKEPYNLWKDEQALDAFILHWETFAKRYKSISSERLSFNLINEPTNPRDEFMTIADHERVMRATVAAIHRIDPDRLIILDGLNWGNEPLPDLVDLNVAQSCRAYLPMGISHYKALWVGGENFPEPVWPGALHDGQAWNRQTLENHYKRWASIARNGIGVHCGEGGAYSYTPHLTFLSWWRDVLEILTTHNIGYALWNFRGSFGVLNSNRHDVIYEDWHGQKLDKQLLDLLQAF
jgi:endoglucanase